MIKLTKEQLRQLSENLREQIIETEQADEVEAAGLTFVFRANISNEGERAYTGVEFLGDKESYIKRNLVVRRLRLEGVFDADGNDVKVDLDVNALDIDYDDETVSVTLVPGWQPARKAVTRRLPATVRTTAA